MNSYIFWVVQVLTTLAISAIAYLLKDIKKTIRDDIDKNVCRVTKLEEEVHRMPGKYVLKEDYQINIRNIDAKFNTVDAKLDRIIDKLMEGGKIK